MSGARVIGNICPHCLLNPCECPVDEDAAREWLASLASPAHPVRPNGYITRPQLWALDEACKPLRATFPDYGPYLVGSVTERPTFRDVDVRLILSDEQYDRLSDDEWGLLGFVTSRHLAAVTGLPIDFQFQRQTEANAAYGHKTRTPLGLRGDGYWYGDQRPSEPKEDHRTGCGVPLGRTWACSCPTSAVTDTEATK